MANNDFETWLNNTVLIGEPETIAEWAWDACQKINDKKIGELEDVLSLIRQHTSDDWVITQVNKALK